MSYTLSTARLALRNVRTYATHIAPRGASAVLHLKTGQSFAGKSFGAPKSVFGETVFSTSITSCKLLFPLRHCRGNEVVGLKSRTDKRINSLRVSITIGYTVSAAVLSEKLASGPHSSRHPGPF